MINTDKTLYINTLPNSDCIHFYLNGEEIQWLTNGCKDVGAEDPIQDIVADILEDLKEDYDFDNVVMDKEILINLLKGIYIS